PDDSQSRCPVVADLAGSHAAAADELLRFPPQAGADGEVGQHAPGVLRKEGVVLRLRLCDLRKSDLPRGRVGLIESRGQIVDVITVAIVDNAALSTFVDALTGAALEVLNVGLHLLVVATDLEFMSGQEGRQSE